MHRSVLALISREVPLSLAESLVTQGLKLAKLKLVDKEGLIELGLSEISVKAIHGEKRPDIKIATIRKLMIDSQQTCCVCNVRGRPIVIHHIKDWAESRSHEESNLVVLCLNCHGEAHTTHSLSVNLTADLVRTHKQNWYQTVNRNRAASAKAKLVGNATDFLWDCFNHKRVVDVAQNLEINISLIEWFDQLRASEIITRSGEPCFDRIISGPHGAPHYLYDGLAQGADRQLLKFNAAVIERILAAIEPVYVSETGSLDTIVNEIVPNAILVCRGHWRFKRNFRQDHIGRQMMKSAHIKLLGRVFCYEFDAWESTSSSALTNMLGRWPCTAVLVVRSVDVQSNPVKVNCTLLATGTSNGWFE